MLTRACRCLFLVLALALAAEVASAQVVTGTPPYSSSGGGPAYSINLANLNVHLTFPVLQKAGRGLPVNMNLTYDNTFWYPAPSGYYIFWQPLITGGWSDSMSNLGGVYFSPVVSGSTTYYCSFVFYDGQRTAHYFPGPSPYICPANSTSTFPIVVPATDGSGYQYTITSCSTTAGKSNCNGYLNSRDGEYIASPVNTGNGVGYVQDRNGNYISEDASGNFTDTLGTVALKFVSTVSARLSHG